MLQDFVNEVRSSNNLQVLTFSVDDKPERVRSYMQQKRYTFPVVVDRDLELRLFPADEGIPKAWVIGPNGFRADLPKTWTFGRTLMEIEKMAKAK